MPKREQYSIQAADQAVNNSTTLVDTDLAVQAEVKRVYTLDAHITVDDTAVDAGVDIKITMPAGAVFVGTIWDADATPTLAQWDGSERGIAEGLGTLHIHGRVVMVATVCEVKVQFAQTAAAVGDTVIKKNSTLMLERISQGAV